MNLEQTYYMEAGYMRGLTSICDNAAGCHRLSRIVCSHRGTPRALLAATAIVAGFLATPLQAQEPSRPNTAQEKVVREMNTVGNVSDAATYEVFYLYHAYQIASVGQTIDGKVRTLENGEKSFKKFQSGLRDADAGTAARSKLQGYVLDWMSDMARGSYSDVEDITAQGRAMAMMLVAELNETDSPAKPLAATLPVLLDAVDGAAFNNDGVRAVALYGLLRHAESGVADADAGAVFDQVAKLATQMQPPKGRDEEIHTYFRTRAVDILGALGSTEKVPSMIELAKVLSATLAAQGSRGVELRCAAASAIGGQNWVGKKNVDLKDISFQLANLAITVTNVASSADELKSRLHSIDLALTGGEGSSDGGIAVAADGDSKEYIDELITQFNLLHDAAFAQGVPGTEIQLAKIEAAKLTDWLIKNPIADAPSETAPESKPDATSSAVKTPAATAAPTAAAPAAPEPPPKAPPAEDAAG
jgi:hypothetical protein